MYSKDSYVKKLVGERVAIVGDGKTLVTDFIDDSMEKYDNIFFHELSDEVCKDVKKIFEAADKTSDEAYFVRIDDKIDIYANSQRAKLYACDMIQSKCNNGIERCCVYNRPNCELRCVKVYIPARKDIPFFKQFIKMCSHYGFNAVMIEIGGAMEYKKHPEINEGWEEYASIFYEYQGKTGDVGYSNQWFKNSIHMENGGGSYLSQAELRELIDYCNRYCMEVIPEVPCLTHSDYILFHHKELAENALDELPDTYCPSNDACYEIVFDILDEVIEVFRPKRVNIGHDEWYSICICDKCKGKDPKELYIEDVKKISYYLKTQGVQTMMWGDKLIPSRDKKNTPYGGSFVRHFWIPIKGKTVSYLGHKHQVYTCENASDWTTWDGVVSEIPETYQAIELLPKDIEVIHWHWFVDRRLEDRFLEQKLCVVYGNLVPWKANYFLSKWQCGQNKGAVISNWSGMDENHMQRNGIFVSVAYAAQLMWRSEFDCEDILNNIIDSADDVFKYHNRDILAQSHISIIHSTNVIHPHKTFVDGYCIDMEKEYMGTYSVEYENGEKDSIPIYWGLNIGCRTLSADKVYSDVMDTVDIDTMLIEPTYRCRIIRYDDGFYYETVYPAKFKVKSVEFIPSSLSDETVIIKSINF